MKSSDSHSDACMARAAFVSLQIKISYTKFKGEMRRKVSMRDKEKDMLVCVLRDSFFCLNCSKSCHSPGLLFQNQSRLVFGLLVVSEGSRSMVDGATGVQCMAAKAEVDSTQTRHSEPHCIRGAGSEASGPGPW